MTGTDVSAAKAKKARSRPPQPLILEMMQMGIVAPKERTGSNQYAITGKLVEKKISFKLLPVPGAAPAKEKTASAPKPKKSAAVVAKAKTKTTAKRKVKVASEPKSIAVAAEPKAVPEKPKVKNAAAAKPAA